MKVLMLSLLLTAFFTLRAHAADPAAGKSKSATCVACHGANGISSTDLWPNLAGQKEQYLLKQLRAFNKGERQDPLMGPVAKMLSDADMQDLAAFFAGGAK